MTKPLGKVYLVGAGPGAPDLLTLRAAGILRNAGIVFHDALVHPDVIALAEQAEKIAVGKRCGARSTAQQFINKRLIDAAQRYDVVVRLKGGDPMLFGRAQEEITALQNAGFAFEIVPGVTAALAASAALGVSLTQRGVARNVVFVTPRVGEHEQSSDWIKSVLVADTAVLYMAAGQATEISSTLQNAGMAGATPVAIVENASLPEQRIIHTTLREMPAFHKATSPTLIMLGEVFRHAQEIEAGISEVLATRRA